MGRRGTWAAGSTAQQRGDLLCARDLPQPAQQESHGEGVVEPDVGSGIAARPGR